MTAENSSPSRARGTPADRFNEAAADDRGKRPRAGDHAGEVVAASMRPRPMTAENVRAEGGRTPDADASMRPRPMTAENGLQIEVAANRLPASMRPRPMTAENSTAMRQLRNVRSLQ